SFTKGNYVIIVGGSGNSLDRNVNYVIEKDLSDICRNSSHTNVKIVGLFERYDRQFHRRVREMNLRFERALKGVLPKRIISVSKHQALKALRENTNMIVLPAYKGNAAVVMILLTTTKRLFFHF
ncbi:hypothetical protein C0J52_11215, partial [Blattella germanica]